MPTMTRTPPTLADFTPKRDFFVGVDSDGCAFDAMEIKHKECFIPSTIRCWGLQSVASAARETWEFVNLYSTSRGQNRWIALVRFFELLAVRREVVERGVRVPAGEELRAFIASGSSLSAAGLREYAVTHPGAEIERGLRWTAAVDEAIETMVQGVPPFPRVRESLAAAHTWADVAVVSATPFEALLREWSEHGLDAHVDAIAGQEMGTKAEQLARAAKGRYDDDRILLIGDAPGDRDAARGQGVLYYPINPGREAESWRRFHDEILGSFLEGTYAGGRQEAVIAEFEALLPATPPWRA